MKQKKAAHTPFLPPSPLLPLGRDTPVLAVGAATLAFTQVQRLKRLLRIINCETIKHVLISTDKQLAFIQPLAGT